MGKNFINNLEATLMKNYDDPVKNSLILSKTFFQKFSFYDGTFINFWHY